MPADVARSRVFPTSRREVKSINGYSGGILVQALRVRRLLVRRFDAQDLLEGRRGLIVVVDFRLPDFADLQQLSHLLGWVSERGRALHLHAHDIGPALIGSIDLLELGHGLEIDAVDVEQVAPGFRGSTG